MKPRPPFNVLARYAALTVVVLNGVVPVAWIALTSLKSDLELIRKPITWLPESPTAENYSKALQEQPLPLFVANSFGVAVLSTLLSVTVSTGAAYAVARGNLRRPGLVLVAIIAVAMCPPASLVTPLYAIMRAAGLLNTWFALVLPNAVLSLPVCTLVLVAYFRSLPKDLEEAAAIDGCRRWQTLLRIVLPLATPGIATAALLAFVNAWDEFLFALAFNASPSARTLPVGILYYQGEYTFPFPVISAAIVVGILPLAAIIVLFQERLIGGLTSGAVKG